MDLANLIDRETNGPLGLGSSSFSQMQSLTRWHLNLAREYPQSFSHVLLILDAVGIDNDLSEMSYRAFNNAANTFTPLESKLLKHELKTLSFMPVAQPLGDIVTTTDGDHEDDSVEKARLLYNNELRRQKNLLSKEAPLLEHIDTSINSLLDDRQKLVVIQRLGLDRGQPKTLENVGESVGVTRERIRQIESKALKKIERVALWDDVFRDKLTSLTQEHGPVLETSFLSSGDKWFKGFELNREGWRLFLKFFAPEYEITTIDDRLFLVAGDPDHAASSLIKKVKALSRHLTPALFELEIEDRMQKSGLSQPYFRDLCISLGEVQSYNMRAIARQFVQETTGVFSIEDFVEFIIKNDLKIQDHRYIENYFSENAIVVSRAPTKYIAPGNLGLSQSEIDNICNEFYAYWLKNFSSERLFQANEIKVWLSKSGLAFRDELTDWWAVAPLKADSLSRFSSNKLQVTLSEAWSDGEKKPSISSLIEEILRVAGEPLPISEIKSRLHPTAGWPVNFQIHESKSVRRVKPGVFSLRKPG